MILSLTVTEEEKLKEEIFKGKKITFSFVPSDEAGNRF